MILIMKPRNDKNAAEEESGGKNKINHKEMMTLPRLPPAGEISHLADTSYRVDYSVEEEIAS